MTTVTSPSTLRASVQVLLIAGMKATEDGNRWRPLPAIEVLAPRDDSENARKRDILHPENTNSQFRFKESERLTVYYAELLMAKWILDPKAAQKSLQNEKGQQRFNAYHSGLAFQSKETGEKALIDFGPHRFDSTLAIMSPEVRSTYPSAIAWAFGLADIQWRNNGWVGLHHEWPARFQNFTRLARVNGSQFYKYVDWVRTNWTKDHKKFDTQELWTVHDRKQVLDSTVCHDFVVSSLQQLHLMGVKVRPVSPIFRDRILIYAKSVSKVSDSLTWYTRRSLLRYLRFVGHHIERLKDNFVFTHSLFEALAETGVSFFMYSQGQYYQVELAQPYVNFCYLELPTPGKLEDPEQNPLMATEILCALPDGFTMNATIEFPDRVIGYEAVADEYFGCVWVICCMSCCAITLAFILWTTARCMNEWRRKHGSQTSSSSISKSKKNGAKTKKS